MSSKHFSFYWKNCTKYVLIHFGTYETCELRSEHVYNFYMKYTVYEITIKTWLQCEFFSPCATNYWRYYATHTLSVFSLPPIRCYNPSRHNRLYSGDMVRISAGSSATLRYSAVFQSLNENAGAVHPLGRDRVLPNPVHFAIHSTVWHFYVSVTYRKVKSIDHKKVPSGCRSTVHITKVTNLFMPVLMQSYFWKEEVRHTERRGSSTRWKCRHRRGISQTFSNCRTFAFGSIHL
jgi:hypothetical protein